MAKITKTRGRKPLAEGRLSLSWGRSAGKPSSYNIGIAPSDAAGRWHTLTLDFGEAMQVTRFFAMRLAGERGWRGGKRDDETAFCDAMAFLIDTL